MIKTIKTGIVVAAALLLAWLLPWLYTFVFASPSWSPFTLYSCVTHSFASLDYDGNGDIAGRDFKGNTYTESQFDSILPMFYYRQLAAEGRFPAEIEGVPVDVHDAERTGFIFRSSPSDLNRPSAGLWQLLESMPSRVDFEAPKDVFRITDDGMEFVDMESNTVDRRKSDSFTRVMKEKGFRFPARAVAGNGSPKKQYDNGYLIVDDAFNVFHVKQMRGRPFVRRTDVPDSLRIRDIFVTEFPDRRLLGFLSNGAGRFYVLEAEDYSLHEIPLGGYDPRRESMMIIGDMFYWTVTVQGEESERLVAVNSRDYSRVDLYEPDTERQAWERTADYIFPFELSFTSTLDMFVRPRFGGVSFDALWLGVLLAAAYAVIRRKSLHGRWLRVVAIAVFGIYMFVPLLVFESKR